MLHEARDLAELTMAAARKSQDTLELHNAHATMGITFVCAGDLVQGRETLETAVRLLPSDFSRSRALEYGQDTMSAAQLWRALALTFMAEYDEAAGAERLAMDWARDVNHPFSLAYAFQMVARRRQLLRDTTGTLQFAEATMNLSQHRGFGQMLAVGGMYAAWAHAQQAAGNEHVDAFSENLARYRRAGSGLQVPHYLGLLAECCAINGNTDKALELIDDGLSLARKDEARLYEGDLLRARGELLRSQGAAEAEAAYREAIDASRRSGARLIEARSAAGLARLLMTQDRRDEADALLAAISALPGDEMRLARGA
jgi:tetratricopeptide (TPR) repeat protein